MPQTHRDNFVGCTLDSISPLHRFSHDAMATVFEIFIVHDDARYAAQTARAAFDGLDKIEQRLSRFIENSDISQINNLGAHQPLQLGLDAFRCLRLSAGVYNQTDGAFDITIGSLLNCWLNEDKATPGPSPQDLGSARQHTGMTLLELNETSHTVTLSASPVRIDVGGIGKGYAVDRMAQLLREWSIAGALIHSGRSSVLALGPPPRAKGWPVTLTNPGNSGEILAHLCLCDQALSGSGLQAGAHIIDPRSGLPAEDKHAAWASASDAATADALSTAFMVMSPAQIENYCLQHPDTLAVIILQDKPTETQGKKVLQFGPWKNNHLQK
jgi:thiamine biosynthesis lipoprotein